MDRCSEIEDITIPYSSFSQSIKHSWARLLFCSCALTKSAKCSGASQIRASEMQPPLQSSQMLWNESINLPILKCSNLTNPATFAKYMTGIARFHYTYSGTSDTLGPWNIERLLSGLLEWPGNTKYGPQESINGLHRAVLRSKYVRLYHTLENRPLTLIDEGQF